MIQKSSLPENLRSVSMVLTSGIRLRKQDSEDREEHESLVDLYLRAMESASTPDVRAA